MSLKERTRRWSRFFNSIGWASGNTTNTGVSAPLRLSEISTNITLPTNSWWRLLYDARCGDSSSELLSSFSESESLKQEVNGYCNNLQRIFLEMQEKETTNEDHKKLLCNFGFQHKFFEIVFNLDILNIYNKMTVPPTDLLQASVHKLLSSQSTFF